MDDRRLDRQIDRLQRLPIQVSVQVCRTSMTLCQFLEWTPGTIVSFEQSALAPLAMCIGNSTVGEGRAVKVGSKIGLHIRRIGDEFRLRRGSE